MGGFKVPRIHADIWLDAEQYNIVGNFSRANGFKNYSQGIRGIINEWRRFKIIVQKLESQVHLEELKNATPSSDEKR